MKVVFMLGTCHFARQKTDRTRYLELVTYTSELREKEKSVSDSLLFFKF